MTQLTEDQERFVKWTAADIAARKTEVRHAPLHPETGKELLSIIHDLDARLSGLVDAPKFAAHLHYEYESAAAEYGWETQEKCRVAWSDLPDANRKTMILAVRRTFETLANARGERGEG